MTIKPNITFVCCVESGPLETQTVRMIESLRRWGGQFANAPIVAVTPRFGPPLSESTNQAFETFNVNYLRFQAKNPYSWKNFMNQRYALIAAEEYSTSEFIGWLDSDLLIVGEPEQLLLKEGEDFVACAPDKNMGTSGLEDPFDPYWQKACQAVGIDIEDLPWITTEMEGIRIRLHWNGGVFVYRRSTGFAQHFLQNSIQLFDARLAHPAAGIFFTQHAVAMTVVKMGISWRTIPHSHNFTMGTKTHAQWYREEQLKEAKIIHYHDSMWPHFWPEFIKCMGNTHPSVADWLSSLGPISNEAPLPWRATNKVLNYFRARRASAYQKMCEIV